MNNQITIISGILSVTLLLPTITAEFLTLAAPNAFGQQAVFDNIDKGSGGPALDITGNNNNVTDYNIVAISTTTGTNNSSSAPSSNLTETIPMITIHDVINSTYIAPKEVDENESERRISRAIRDRVNDIFHTVVMNNATIISTARITNGFWTNPLLLIITQDCLRLSQTRYGLHWQGLGPSRNQQTLC